MKILVTGGTGFIGRALVARLLGAGHRVRVMTRSEEKARAILGADVELVRDPAVDGCDAVINLAGENVADARWSEARKKELYDSRIGLTRRLVEEIAKAKPKVLISASGIGFYGNGGDQVIDERSPRGEGFLCELCEEWERAANEAQNHGVRVAIFRIGAVLGRDGGALKKMLPPFKLGIGGRLGSGKQWFPWIHREDLIDMFLQALDRWSGVFNGVAPEPVTNAELTRELGRVLHRPVFLPVPPIALKAMFGELSVIMLEGQRAVPTNASELGFVFRFPTLDLALRDLLSHSPAHGRVARSEV